MYYNDFGTWIRKQFPDFRVQKISIDADSPVLTEMGGFRVADVRIATTAPSIPAIATGKSRLLNSWRRERLSSAGSILI